MEKNDINKETKVICLACNQKMFYCDLLEHLKKCLNEKLICEYCLKYITKKYYSLHLDICGDVLLCCDNCIFSSERKNFEHTCQENNIGDFKELIYSHFSELKTLINSLLLDFNIDKNHKKINKINFPKILNLCNELLKYKHEIKFIKKRFNKIEEKYDLEIIEEKLNIIINQIEILNLKSKEITDIEQKKITSLNKTWSDEFVKLSLLWNSSFICKDRLLHLECKKIIKSKTANVITYIEYLNSFLCGFDCTIELINVDSWNTLKVIEVDSKIIDLCCLNFYKIGCFASCGSDLKIWNLTENEPIKTYKFNFEIIKITSLNKYFNKLAVVFQEGNLILFDLDTNKINKVENIHSKIKSLEYFKKRTPSNILATGGDKDDKLLCLWDLDEAKLFNKRKGHKGAITAIVYYKENIFFTSSEDFTIKIWLIYTTDCLSTIEYHTSCVNGLIVFPNEDILLSHSSDNYLIVYNLSKEIILRKYELIEKISYVMGQNSIDFKFIMSGFDRNLYIYE